jgi:hypothetical protein
MFIAKSTWLVDSVHRNSTEQSEHNKNLEAMKSENLFYMSLIPLIFSISRPSRLQRANLHGNPRRTGKPPGKPVDEDHVFVFLLIVALDGFYSDIIRTNSFHGALMLGLAILDDCRSAPLLGLHGEKLIQITNLFFGCMCTP